MTPGRMIFVLRGVRSRRQDDLPESSLPRWTGRGVACGGFLSVAVTASLAREGYDLLEIRTGRRHPYLRATAGPTRSGPAPFVVCPRRSAWPDVIREAAPGDLLIVDEVGPLELGGGRRLACPREARSDLDRESVRRGREGSGDAVVGPSGSARLDRPRPASDSGRLFAGGRGDDDQGRFFTYFRDLFGGSERAVDLPPAGRSATPSPSSATRPPAAGRSSPATNSSLTSSSWSTECTSSPSRDWRRRSRPATRSLFSPCSAAGRPQDIASVRCGDFSRLSSPKSMNNSLFRYLPESRRSDSEPALLGNI